MNHRCVIVIGLMMFGALVWAPSAWSQNGISGDTDLKGRLKKLADEIEAKRHEFNIPGMAIAIVKDDAVVLCRGFGLADIEKNIPVTDETVFAIGSSTKALTGAMVAILVTDGVMSWDDPVTKYLPEFKLPIKSENVNDQVTIRDLLSHRTGFFNMELVGEIFAKEDHGWTREKLLGAVVKSEPRERFRGKFLYNNIGFLAAGMASGKATGTDWDSLMAKRMFEPLGMTSSTTLTRQAQQARSLAVGYMNESGKNNPIPLKDLDVIAPAGGVLSNARDMGQWLRLIVNHGVYNGKRLIGEKELNETWTKQIKGSEPLPPGIDYGLGWTLAKWKGHLVVTHPGNSLGFSGELAVLPDYNLGVVMLSNVLPNPIQFTVRDMVWKTLVGDSTDRGD